MPVLYCPCHQVTVRADAWAAFASWAPLWQSKLRFATLSCSAEEGEVKTTQTDCYLSSKSYTHWLGESVSLPARDTVCLQRFTEPKGLCEIQGHLADTFTVSGFIIRCVIGSGGLSWSYALVHLKSLIFKVVFWGKTMEENEGSTEAAKGSKRLIHEVSCNLKYSVAVSLQSGKQKFGREVLRECIALRTHCAIGNYREEALFSGEIFQCFGSYWNCLWNPRVFFLSW